MPVNYLAALQSGVNFANDLEDRARQDRAFRALEDQHGAIAGDPARAGQLQSLDLARSADARAQEAAKRDEDEYGNERQRSAALNAAYMVKQAIGRGEDPGAAFDRVAPILQAAGEDPSQLPVIRQQVMDNPAVVDDIISTLTAQNASDLPAGIREFNTLVEAANSDEPERRSAARVRLGLDPRAVSQKIEMIGNVPHLVDTETGVRTPLSDLQAEARGEQVVEAAGATGREVGQSSVERLNEAQDQALDASQTLQSINAAQEALDAGIRTGFGAQTRTQINRAVSLMTGDTPPETDNLDVYLASVGRLVGENIKAFGSGTGLSDKDREFAERMSGGDIQATPEALNRILDISRRAAQGRIQRYNDQRGRFIERNPDAADLYPELGETSSSDGDFTSMSDEDLLAILQGGQ